MSKSAHRKEDMHKRMGELATLRDQIRLDLHLAGMDLRDEWNELERKLPEIDQTLQPLKNATRDALDALADELRRFGERLRDGAEFAVGTIMTSGPVCCAPADSLAQALTTMWERDVGCLPVVAANGRLVGMITDRDAAIAAASRGQRMDDLRVDSAMSTNIVSCAPATAYDEALALMRARQVRRLPVVAADGVLAGIVTLNDIARAFGGGADSPRRRSVAHHIVKTLVAVSEPPESGVTSLN